MTSTNFLVVKAGEPRHVTVVCRDPERSGSGPLIGETSFRRRHSLFRYSPQNYDASLPAIIAILADRGRSDSRIGCDVARWRRRSDVCRHVLSQDRLPERKQIGRRLS